jgi:hypothetical protein
VVLLSTGECGVVIHAWTDGETGATDCYVAFFGSEFPKSDEPTNATPHVLRYAATSLRREP